jgi:hypothetical protein
LPINVNTTLQVAISSTGRFREVCYPEIHEEAYYISLFHQLDVDVVNVIIKRVKLWCLVCLFQVIYAPYCVSGDEKGI